MITSVSEPGEGVGEGVGVGVGMGVSTVFV